MPLTMSVERETEIFNYTNLFHADPALADLRVELQAERAAHKRTQEALVSAEATIMVLSDPKIVAALSAGLGDVKAGRFKSLDCVDGGCEKYKLEEQLRHSREVSTALLNALKKCNFSLGQAVDRAERHSLVGEGPYTWEDNCAEARAAIALADRQLAYIHFGTDERI